LTVYGLLDVVAVLCALLAIDEIVDLALCTLPSVFLVTGVLVKYLQQLQREVFEVLKNKTNHAVCRDENNHNSGRPVSIRYTIHSTSTGTKMAKQTIARFKNHYMYLFL
jgi:hypothetical protein